jgi:hypothetical protein
MMRLSSFLTHCLAGLILLGTLAGCEGNPIEPEPSPEIREIILRTEDGDFIFSHSDHWHGAPVVREGESTRFTLFFTSIRATADDHDLQPVESWFSLAEHEGFNVHVVIEDTQLARWEGDRVSGSLHGLRAGASRLSIVVRRGTTTVYEAPPLNFRVQAATN